MTENTTTATQTIYRCGNKRCGQYLQEFAAMSIAGAVQATGRRVCCHRCGRAASFIRNVLDPTAVCVGCGQPASHRCPQCGRLTCRRQIHLCGHVEGICAVCLGDRLAALSEPARQR